MSEKRYTGKPQPGHFLLRRVKDGPWLPACIEYGPAVDPDTGEDLDRSWLWTASINGHLIADPSPDPLAAGVLDIWEANAPRIDEAEYKYRIATKEWSEEYAPHNPEARPFEPVDYNLMDPVFADGPTGDATPAELGYPDPPRLPPVTERLEYTYRDLLARRDALPASAEKVPTEIKKKADASSLVDFDRQLRAFLGLVKARYHIERAVYDNAAHPVEMFFDVGIERPIRAVRRRGLDLLTAYQQEKSGGEAVEGQYGGKFFTRRTKRIEIDDPTKVDLNQLAAYLPKDMIARAARLRMEDGKGLVDGARTAEPQAQVS